MKVKLITAIIATSLLTISTAHAMPPKPEKCPDVSALKSVEFDAVVQVKHEWIAAVKTNYYGTNDRWTFIISKIQADDKEDARIKAMEGMRTLTSLSNGPGPLLDHTWICYYSNAKNYPAGAMTPAFPLVRKLQQYFLG